MEGQNEFQNKTAFSTRKNRPANVTNAVGKIPPQAVDLEQAVLGALMLEKDALSSVIDILKPDIFYQESHKKIFEAIQQLFQKSKPVDILTVSAEMRQLGTLEMIGGAYYISYLTDRVASAANIEYHARIISQKYIQRELIRISTEIINYAYEDTSDIFDLLDYAEKNLFEIAQNNLRRDTQKMDEVIKKSLATLEKLRAQTDGLTGVPSGFTDLDRITGGWQKSDLVIIAARPAMGKTAFVLSCARNAAVSFQKPVVVFSLEMSSVQLVNRLIAGEAEIEQEKIKKGNLAEWEWKQLHSKIGPLSESTLLIDDTPALNIFEFRAKCRRLKSQYDIQMIIIDYLQLMHSKGDGQSGVGNREQEIGSISRALKSVAKELDVPVLALSQLSRAVESRPGPNGKRPVLSDLRESGSIEQDADMVLFLYRPEYYGISEDELGRSTVGIGEIIIGKNRNGKTGIVPLRFIGKYVKFADLEDNFMLSPSPSNLLIENNSLISAQNFDRPNENIIIRPSKANDMMDDEAPF